MANHESNFGRDLNQIAKRRARILPVASVALTFLIGSALYGNCKNVAESQPRDEKWAKPVLGTLCIPNLYKMSDDFYRSAQFNNSEAGVAALQKLGIRTVISLRHFHNDPKTLLEKYKIEYHHIASNAWHPEANDVKDFLSRVATSPKPILIHCERGADRTGFMSAVYRIVVQDWTKEAAECELLRGGYGASRFLARLSRRFIDRTDLFSLASAGLARSKVQQESPHPHPG
jgi:protein tyrosine phosphatase (PTP) superfamily phosphohydrolase (DUF442 family)